MRSPHGSVSAAYGYETQNWEPSEAFQAIHCTKTKCVSALMGMQPRTLKHGAVPPNENQGKYPNEVYGDTEIPFRT